MKIELIQPFINSTDAVLAEMLRGEVEVTTVAMNEEVYKRKGVAASVAIRGDIVGHIIFDLEPETARRVAAALAGEEVDAGEAMASETVCELANIVVGNAVTLLNDQGYSFKVTPPLVHTSETGFAGNIQSEALVMCFNTPSGKAYLNIAMDYSHQEASRGSEISHERAI